MYDLRQPHQKIVSKNSRPIILQDGNAYEHGSKRMIGPIVDLKEKLSFDKDNEFCGFCGGTFTDKGDFEEHLIVRHLDILQASAAKGAPRVAKGRWVPDDKMIKEEAAKISGREITEALDEEVVPNLKGKEKVAYPHPAPVKRAPKAEKKMANWREEA